MDQLTWPPRGCDAEKKSFKYQCDRFIEVATPSYEERERYIDTTNVMYMKFENPSYLDYYHRPVWSREIDRLKLLIKPDASPGVPLARIANLNGELLKKMGQDFNDLVLDRIERMLSLSPYHVQDMSRKDCIDNNLMDPIRVFVKNEPHKHEKVDTGRVRLISSVSLVDKMVEMLLHHTIQKHEIRNWRFIPSKPGIGFDADTARDFYDRIERQRTRWRMADSDVSGWDFGVKGFMFSDNAEAEIKLCKNPSGVYTHLMRVEALLFAKPVFQFSDGTLVAPRYEGIMASGRQTTSSSNSRIRSMTAIRVGAPVVNAAGDDTVEGFVEGAIAKYASLGIRIKDYREVDSNGFNFCSRWYQSQGSFPLGGCKALFNFVHSTIKDEDAYDMALCQFTEHMQDHPEFSRYMSLLEDVGFLRAGWSPKNL